MRPLILAVLLAAGCSTARAGCPPTNSGSANTGDVLYNTGESGANVGCANSKITIDSTGIDLTIPGSLTFTFTDLDNNPAGAHLTFPNLSALKTFQLANLGSNMVSATTAGFTAAGDGGGATYDYDSASTKTDGILNIRPNNQTTGAWVLRIDAGGLHPQQFGAKCDGATDDSAAFNGLTNLASPGENNWTALRIALRNGDQCYLGSTWTLPYGATVDGGYTPNQRGLNKYASGFVLLPSATLQMADSSTIQNMLISRWETTSTPPGPLTGPTSYTQVAPEVAQWGTENGAIVAGSIAPTGGASGSGGGCSVGDVLALSGGQGTPAMVQVSQLSSGGSGAVTGVNVLRYGAYLAFPSNPASSQKTSLGTTCNPFPTFNFQPGVQRSAGIVEKQDDSVNNVLVVGFNVGLVALGQSASFHNLYFDDYNGVDVSLIGDNAFCTDSHGIAYWSANVPSNASQGAYAVLGYPVNGTGYSAGTTYTLSPVMGACQTAIQVIVNSVNASGGITSASLASAGACKGVTNPVPVAIPPSGTAAQLTLQLVGSDFRPGVAYSFHDQCDGCAASNLTEHGWLTGMYLSNVWTMNIDNFVVECGTGLGSYGLQVQNATSAVITHAHVGGCQYPLELDGAPGPVANLNYTYIPPLAPGANTSTNVTIFGGEANCDGNANDADKCPNIVHAGVSSSGLLFGYDFFPASNLSYCSEGPAETDCPVQIEAGANWTLRNLLGTATPVYASPTATVNSDVGSMTCTQGTAPTASFTVANGFVTHC